MALLSTPEAVLKFDGGVMELADDGDREIASTVLRRLAVQFGATVQDHMFRNLFGDTEREREYWWLDIRGRKYMLMRATAPEAPPGVCLGGPISTSDDLVLFRAIAASFGAKVQDRRSPLRKGWWRFWG